MPKKFIWHSRCTHCVMTEQEKIKIVGDIFEDFIGDVSRSSFVDHLLTIYQEYGINP